MKQSTIAIICLVIIGILAVAFIPNLIKDDTPINSKPVVEFTYPSDGDSVSNIVTFSGTATDPDGIQTIKKVEILINETWFEVDGIATWSYTWNIFNVDDGFYTIVLRAWDGAVFSEEKQITIYVSNPEIVDSDAHKWAVFIVASNFPKQNESKLGNGGLYLAEEIVAYFIEAYKYSTRNIYILFDDGWIRADNGYGSRLQTLQERYHKYDITYGGATIELVESTLNKVVDEANRYGDSEVFIHISSHGCGDNSNTITGGKFLERSGVYLWDEFLLTDKKLGDLLQNLESKKTCVFVDACYAGGFADKTIKNFPEFFLFKSDIARDGRVVIAGTSKFRVGYASTQNGALFSNLWFDGIQTGDADGYRAGFLKNGRPTNLGFYKDGKVSVEEAFYYAKYALKNDELFKDFSRMEPQINDQFPSKGILRSLGPLILGE